jgi:RimJ/RimL family protein N-acetyltransferase
MTSVVLQGPRIRLRQWEERDRARFAGLNADPAAMEFFPSTLTRAESDAMVDRLRAAIGERGWGFWCLEVDGNCAGFTGLNVPSFDAPFLPAIEIGWRLLPAYWGRGLAAEAARLALAYGFADLGAKDIVAFTAVRNIRSRALMERLGMRHEPAADFDHPRVAEGHPLRRHVLYRLSRPAS